MGRFDSTLSDRMGHQEEVEAALNDLGLLDEALINVGSLRRVQNLVVCLLKESLSHALIDDDECDMGERATLRLGVIFVGQDFLELIKFEADDLLAHRVTDTITIDEDVVGQRAAVVVAISRQSTAEVILKNV